MARIGMYFLYYSFHSFIHDVFSVILWVGSPYLALPWNYLPCHLVHVHFHRPQLAPLEHTSGPTQWPQHKQSTWSRPTKRPIVGFLPLALRSKSNFETSPDPERKRKGRRSGSGSTEQHNKSSSWHCSDFPRRCSWLAERATP